MQIMRVLFKQAALFVAFGVASLVGIAIATVACIIGLLSLAVTNLSTLFREKVFVPVMESLHHHMRVAGQERRLAFTRFSFERKFREANQAVARAQKLLL